MEIVQPSVNRQLTLKLSLFDTWIASEVFTLYEDVGLDGLEVLLGFRDTGLEHLLS